MREYEDLNQQRDEPCSRIGRLNIKKILLLPKLIYRFYTIPIGVFVELDKIVQDQETVRTLLKKNKVSVFALQITKLTIEPQ